MKTLIRNVNEADPGDNALFRKWQDKYHDAIERMNAVCGNEGALIEVAAQHPLVDGRFPNEEFAARLDEAARLYRELKAEGTREVKIYVPGSVHKFNGVTDSVSLSDAGCAYLLEKGIPEEDVLGDEENRKYKGEQGVYNSSDECYVASRIFEDRSYGALHCVCSPAQLLRKALSYIAFGCVPYMHSVPVENMFHSYVDEAFLYIPRLLSDANGLQGDSEEADRLRQLRKPVEGAEEGA